jgi:hypothetical protein
MEDQSERAVPLKLITKEEEDGKCDEEKEGRKGRWKQRRQPMVVVALPM